MQPVWSIRVGPKSSVLLSPKLDDSVRAFETLVFFSRPKRLLHQICRWHHPYGRKWRGTKKPLDESGKGEWKIGLKLNIQKTKIMASGPIMVNRWGNSGNSGWFYFSGLQNHCRWWLQPWNLKTLMPWKESYDQPRQHIKKQRHYFANKGPSSQAYGFSSGHVWMDVRVGLWRKLSSEELMLLNCGVGEDSWESLGLQGNPTSPS